MTGASYHLLQHDDQKVKDFGVNLAVDMIRQLQRGGIEGVHFCTLNLEKSVIRVLESLGLAGNIPTLANRLISVRRPSLQLRNTN